MRDLRDPKERQRFLQESIDRNLKLRKSKEGKDGVMRGVIGNNSLMQSLADLFELLENKDETEYRRLLKQFRLGA